MAMTSLANTISFRFDFEKFFIGITFVGTCMVLIDDELHSRSVARAPSDKGIQHVLCFYASHSTTPIATEGNRYYAVYVPYIRTI
jgi:hypothetical protein